SYGLTTIHNNHVEVRGAKMHFHFRGKSGRDHEIDLEDPRLANIVRECQHLPGHELFGYVDENGEPRDVKSEDVNDYLREITGQDFTAKDFRTWAGTVLAARALQEFEAVDSQAKRKKNIVRAVETVAKKLGNTKAVCRKCYIHPQVIETYMDGSFKDIIRQSPRRKVAISDERLHHDEAAVLALLEQHAARERAHRRRRHAPNKPV